MARVQDSWLHCELSVVAPVCGVLRDASVSFCADTLLKVTPRNALCSKPGPHDTEFACCLPALVYLWLSANTRTCVYLQARRHEYPPYPCCPSESDWPVVLIDITLERQNLIYMMKGEQVRLIVNSWGRTLRRGVGGLIWLSL